jgi:hypothetical protein
MSRKRKKEKRSKNNYPMSLVRFDPCESDFRVALTKYDIVFLRAVVYPYDTNMNTLTPFYITFVREGSTPDENSVNIYMSRVDGYPGFPYRTLTAWRWSPSRKAWVPTFATYTYFAVRVENGTMSSMIPHRVMKERLTILASQHAHHIKSLTLTNADRFPKEISYFTELRTLEMRDSVFFNVPLQISQLKHLQVIDLRGNKHAKDLERIIVLLLPTVTVYVE